MSAQSTNRLIGRCLLDPSSIVQSESSSSSSCAVSAPISSSTTGDIVFTTHGCADGAGTASTSSLFKPASNAAVVATTTTPQVVQLLDSVPAPPNEESIASRDSRTSITSISGIGSSGGGPYHSCTHSSTSDPLVSPANFTSNTSTGATNTSTSSSLTSAATIPTPASRTPTTTTTAEIHPIVATCSPPLDATTRSSSPFLVPSLHDDHEDNLHRGGVAGGLGGFDYECPYDLSDLFDGVGSTIHRDTEIDVLPCTPEFYSRNCYDVCTREGVLKGGGREGGIG